MKNKSENYGELGYELDYKEIGTMFIVAGISIIFYTALFAVLYLLLRWLF